MIATVKKLVPPGPWSTGHIIIIHSEDSNEASGS